MNSIVKPVIGLLALGSILPVFGQQVQVKPSDIAGAELLGPASPDFNFLLAKLISPAERTQLETALPFCVIVRNSGQGPIDRIEVRFDFISPKTQLGSSGTVGSGLTLAPGAAELFAPAGAISALRHAGGALASAASQHLADVGMAPVASIDSIVFESGEFVGPDRAGHFRLMSAERAKYDATLQEIASMKDSPDEAVVARLTQIVKAGPEFVDGHKPVTSGSSIALALLRTLTGAGRAKMEEALLLYSATPPYPSVWKR